MSDSRKRAGDAASSSNNGDNTLSKRPKLESKEEREQRIAAAKAAIEAKLAKLKVSKPPIDGKGVKGTNDVASKIKDDSNNLDRQRNDRLKRIEEAQAQPSESAKRQKSSQDVQRYQYEKEMGLHPILQGNMEDLIASIASRGKKQPKGAPSRAPAVNGRRDLEPSPTKSPIPQSNPYIDPNVNALPSRRARPTLTFNEHGKYIQRAEELRNKARLEELKQRIAQQSKAAKADDGFESTRAFIRPEPPTIEWWDQDLLRTGVYDDLDNNNLKIDTEDSPIMIYIQHPVPIPPPSERNAASLKPPPLTSNEQKKKRRQDRALERSKKQDKIKLGLLPPDPPKVKLSNLMSVMTQEAIKDPTAVEAKVRREVAERREKHVQDNEERKLNPDERWKKKVSQHRADASVGLHCSVFRVESLDHQKHRSKVKLNARQRYITGCVLRHPKFCLIIAEGGAKSMKQYQHLLLERMEAEWRTDEPTTIIHDTKDAEPEQVQLDLSNNRCELIWDGEIKTRIFHGFREQIIEDESDVAARQALGKRAQHFWNLAKSRNVET